MKSLQAFALSYLVAVFISHPLLAENYTLDPSKNTDTIQFRSQAMLEVVDGSTTQAIGSFRFDPKQLQDSTTGIIMVDLRTLETGIKMRDQHMRDEYLETEKFPHAFFQLVSLSGLPAEWKSDTTYELSANGYFYIHGFKRKLTALVRASQEVVGEKSQISFRATFSVNLESFKIKRPKVIFLKLAETMAITVILKGYSGLEPSPVALPDWPELR